MADDASKDASLKILDAQLCVRKVQLKMSKFQEIQQTLETIPIHYPITRVELKTHSVAQGISSLNWENAVVGQLPTRVVVGMTDNDSFIGNIGKNPFNFKNFALSEIALYLNGETVGAPIKLNFENDQYLDGYRTLFSSTGRLNADSGLDIRRRDYKNGYCLVGFDTTPALCHGGHQEVSKRGTMRVNLEFKNPLPNSINVLLYLEYDNTISVNSARYITKDY